jgi:hypothetical protein
MKLRSERGKNGDFSGPKGEFENRFLDRKTPLSTLAVAGFMKYAG